MPNICTECEHCTDVKKWTPQTMCDPSLHRADFRCKLPPYKVGGNAATKADLLAPCSDNNKDGLCPRFSRRVPGFLERLIHGKVAT